MNELWFLIVLAPVLAGNPQPVIYEVETAGHIQLCQAVGNAIEIADNSAAWELAPTERLGHQPRPQVRPPELHEWMLYHGDAIHSPSAGQSLIAQETAWKGVHVRLTGWCWEHSSE